MTAPAHSLLHPPSADRFVRFADDFGTRFALVVDTEEEFDWAAPFDRESRAVTHVAAMARGQEYFARAGVVPLYVTDWPVVADPAAREAMASWLAEGKAEIGAHLHPWVNPPHEEAVCNANSYAGNLPEALERAKLTALRDRLTEAFGRAPIAYRAGRYGIGSNSERILADLGFRVDTSVRSRFDYRHQHGPDFRRMPLRPWWTREGLLELPLSTAWTGWARRLGDALYPMTERLPRAPGVLARSGALARVPLTPEGVPAAEAIRAIDALLAEDVPLLMFSFHSPTLAPGHTPYTRTAVDVDAFFGWWDRVLGHLARRGVAPAALPDIVQAAGNPR